MSEQISKIDRASVKRIAAATEEALQMVAEDLGLTLESKGGSFDPGIGTFAPKFEFKVDGADESDFARSAPLYGLSADDYGREFTSRGTQYRVTGINARAPKFPLQAERLSDGKRFKFTTSVIDRLAA